MVALYIWFIFNGTDWWIKTRAEMNKQDSEANQRTIDSLLNFETVKYFAAEPREIARYDESNKCYGRLALKTEFSLAF